MDRPPLCPVLVGRDDLLALADRRLAAARQGTGHLLCFAGEAGIGKTRLLATVRARAADEGFLVAGVGAYPRDAEVAGGVLSDLAAALRRLPGTAGIGAAMAQRLAEGLDGRGDGDAYRQRRLLVADLADLLVQPAMGHGLGNDDVPVLLSVEDLHWADELTLQVLDRIAGHLAAARMLLVTTYRSDELYPRVPLRAWRARLLNQRLAEEARLTRLQPAQTAAMVAAITATTAPEALVRAVHERSDGIPLHVEEFLPLVGRPRVPDTLADAVLARTAALSGPARRLAGAASVLGHSFGLDLLAALTDEPPDALDEALRELHERFFVQPRGDEETYDFRHALIREALYADLPPHRRRDLHARAAAAAVAAGFRDAFVSDQYERAQQPANAYRYALAAARESAALSSHREAVELYRRAQRTTPNDVPPRDRADLSAALARELAAVDENEAAADTYAEAHRRYRELGAEAEAAAQVPGLVAARHLLGAGLEERTGLLREALARLPADPPAPKTPSHEAPAHNTPVHEAPALNTPSRETPAHNTPVHEASAHNAPVHEARTNLVAALAAAYMLDRRLDEAIAHGLHARTLAAGTGDRAARIDTDVTLGSVLVFAGRMDEGWALLESAVGEARAANLEAQTARGYRMLGSSASVLVEYERAERWLREGVTFAERTERFNDRHYMAAHLAHTHWAVGEWAAAERLAGQALADGRGGVTTRITALHVLGYLAVGRGDQPAAETHLHEARSLGEEMGELQRLAPALWGLAESALHGGQPAEAVRWCERGYAASAATRDAAYLFPFAVTGARAYLALDDPTGARDWVERVAELLLLRGIPGTLPALDHARGLLHLADGHTGRAREALTAAGVGWDGRRRFWEGTQALLDRAKAAHRSRRPAEATTLTNEAVRRAVAGGAGVLVAGAAPAPEPGPLTARESEIAALVATGATNREIAASLTISPKTVAAHIEHILTKLGASRRAEIAAWAAGRSR